MDPISIGLLMMAGAGGVAAWARRRKGAKNEAKGRPRPPVGVKPAPKPVMKEPPIAKGLYGVGDVLQYLGDEFWLAGELTLVREGEAAVRLYSAPERGAARWVAMPRTGDVLFVLRADPTLHAMGWPGTEVPVGTATLRPVEKGSCQIEAAGELDDDWRGPGRYGLYRAMETVALVLEQNGRRLALTGKAVPKRLVEKLG